MKESIATVLAATLNRMRYVLRPAVAMEKNCRSLLFHRKNLLAASPAVTTTDTAVGEIPDKELIRRIIVAYQRANKADIGNSMWANFFASYHLSIHQALIAGSEKTVTEILRNPGASDLFYGFDILTKSFQGDFRREKVRRAYAKLCLDGLVRFAESVGAVPMDNPETWPQMAGTLWETENVMAELDKMCAPFSVPNPFPNEHGVSSSRGVISYRVPQAFYQAWRIKQLVNGIQNPRVLEIGAGLGRTAYYAHELGIKDYTIVDLPITTVAQAYYLGRTLGEENIHLDGEQLGDGSPRVKIVSPQTFLGESKTYDLVLNVDSLTEMDSLIAKTYWKKIKTSTNIFLSINHEANKFRVRDLIAEDMSNLNVARGLYWMRRGYAEELIQIHGAQLV